MDSGRGQASVTTETQQGANGRAVLAATAGRGERAGAPPPRTDRGDGAAAADRGPGPGPDPGGDGPVAEAAVGYARSLGWPLTPGYPVDGELCGCGLEQCPDYGAHPVPGAWKVAACATPSLVRVIWRMSAGAPVLAVLGRPVPGAARLGAVRVPALIGVAALELLSKRTAAEGPAVDGHGRISFLVDLGPGTAGRCGPRRARHRDGADLRAAAHARIQRQVGRGLGGAARGRPEPAAGGCGHRGLRPGDALDVSEPVERGALEVQVAI
jgi:hypothetical protein